MNTLGRVSRRRLVYGALKIALTVLILIAGLLTPATPAAAQAATAWRGEYYNNTNLSGAPAFVRDDPNIDFDWGVYAPAVAIASDRFAARWTNYLYFDEGDYTFNVTVDDGVRLWIDGQLLIDEWRDQSTTTYSAVLHLNAGHHSLRMEYYENTGDAVAKLWWNREGSHVPAGDWRGEYFSNTWLGGQPVLVRGDRAVNFDWGYGSPASGIPADGFAARWTRNAHFDAGNYVFTATVDDGVRVWVDGALVIDKWYPQSRTTHSNTVYLAAGTHEVRVEYFEQTGVAVCMVSWSGGGGQPTPQEIIVDDRDANFTFGGPSSGWYGRNTGYRSHLYWTWSSPSQIHNWGRWHPHISQAGTWEVYVYIPNRYHGSKSARYVIRHNGTEDAKVVNQNIYNNQWVSLGSYYFSGGPDEYVFLGDNTGEVYGTRFVGFDACKFVLRSSGPGPEPTPAPSGCAITPVLGFGRVWFNNSTVRTKLGCPTDQEHGIWMAEQPFQGGYMFWRQDQSFIYVLFNNGTWQGFEDTWSMGEPEWDPNIVPPYGYYQPKRGFGKVWRDNSNVRNTLSWATTEERGFFGTLQPYEGGLMLWSHTRGIIVLYNDGRWERFN